MSLLRFELMPFAVSDHELMFKEGQKISERKGN